LAYIHYAIVTRQLLTAPKTTTFTLSSLAAVATWFLPGVWKTHGIKGGWQQTALVIVCLFIH